MLHAILIGIFVGLVCFNLLYFVELWWHKRRHNRDRSYRWGVWLFSILAALYAFLTSLGR